MFVRNCWYVAGFSPELGQGPLARRICGQPVVLFRDQAGRAAALEDRCWHRGVPLSAGGQCEAGIIRCPYHGLEFDRSGQCTKIPGQSRPAAGVRVRNYKLEERDAILWIWPGEQDLADPALIPSHPYHDDPEWVWNSGMLEVKAHAQLIVDNLLDLSHLQYVHRNTIGGDPERESRAELHTERLGNLVRVRRWLRDVDPPPLHRLAAGYPGRIDRWQEFEWRPGVLQFHSGSTETGIGGLEGNREKGVHIRHFHGVTPETEDSTLYFYSSARNFRIDDTELTAKMGASTRATFMEDQLVLEAQQARLREDPARPLFTLRNDQALILARRITEELLSTERDARPFAPAAGAAETRMQAETRAFPSLRQAAIHPD